MDRPGPAGARRARRSLWADHRNAQSFPAAPRNALDHLFAEWHEKAGGCVSHGVHGGVRAGSTALTSLRKTAEAT